MKLIGTIVLAAAVGYIVGLFGGMGAVELLSSNTHDRSLEAAMTGAFVIGPLVAIVAVIVVLIYRSSRKPA
jgi:hypothetical protein